MNRSTDVGPLANAMLCVVGLTALFMMACVPETGRDNQAPRRTSDTADVVAYCGTPRAWACWGTDAP